MTLDELKASWETDCAVGDNLGQEAARNPVLHSKYLNELIAAKMKLSKLQLEISSLRALKARYFRGELTTEELKDLGWEQWQFRSLKADIPEMIDADVEMQKLLARQEYMKAMIYFLESVMGEIKSRSFNIRSAIEWVKFRAGS